MSKFMNLDEALGRLVINEIEFKLNKDGNNWTIETNCGGIFCYRDGTSYKVKREYIEDLIDAQEWAVLLIELSNKGI